MSNVRTAFLVAVVTMLALPVAGQPPPGPPPVASHTSLYPISQLSVDNGTEPILVRWHMDCPDWCTSWVTIRQGGERVLWGGEQIATARELPVFGLPAAEYLFVVECSAAHIERCNGSTQEVVVPSNRSREESRGQTESPVRSARLHEEGLALWDVRCDSSCATRVAWNGSATPWRQAEGLLAARVPTNVPLRLECVRLYLSCLQEPMPLPHSDAPTVGSGGRTPASANPATVLLAALAVAAAIARRSRRR